MPKLDFLFNFLRLLGVAVLFRRATVNRPSSIVNVSYANEQTDIILVPYLRYLDTGAMS
jgi:hypothetical protein